MCDYENFSLLTDLEETLIGADGEVALLAPRVLAAWYDREGSRGEGFLGCYWHARQGEGGPGARAKKPGRRHMQQK
jgi:hypothetical protein